jgi:DNA-binding NarL/FixJ family response regulator
LAIRIVLAEEDYFVREGVRRLLETQPDIEVVATCDDLDSLLDAVDVERPDVVLTDIRTPPGGTDEGIRAAARLRQTHPNTAVVVLSQFADPEDALALLEQGSERRGLSAQGASPGSRAARGCDPRGRGGRLGHRLEGGRVAHLPIAS